jgi:hypothetical protein
MDRTHLSIHGLYQQTLFLEDTSKADLRLVATLYAVNITGDNVILGMPWLTHKNPDLHWDQNH